MSVNRFTEELCGWLYQISKKELDKENERVLSLLLLDWLACVLLGQQKKIVRCLNSITPSISPLDGHQLLGFQTVKTHLEAALIYGASAHALELDDSEFVGETHPSAVIFSSLLPLSKPTTTIRELLKPAWLGYLTLLPLGQKYNPEHYESGWHGTGTLGIFAAAVGAAFFQGIKRNQLASLFSLAATQAAGIHAVYGTEIKPLNAGKAAQNGLIAAMMAVRGVEGSKDIFEAQFGFTAKYAPLARERSIDFNTIPISNLSWIKPKRYPSCHCTHAAIKALGRLNTQYQHEEIKEIEIWSSRYSIEMTQIRKPKSIDQAFFSLSYCAALTLTVATPSLQAFQDNLCCLDSLEDKIKCFIDDSLERMEVRVIVKLTNDYKILLSEKIERTFEDESIEFVDDKFSQLISPILSSSQVQRIKKAFTQGNTTVQEIRNLTNL